MTASSRCRMQKTRLLTASGREWGIERERTIEGREMKRRRKRKGVYVCVWRWEGVGGVSEGGRGREALGGEETLHVPDYRQVHPSAGRALNNYWSVNSPASPLPRPLAPPVTPPSKPFPQTPYPFPTRPYSTPLSSCPGGWGQGKKSRREVEEKVSWFC